MVSCSCGFFEKYLNLWLQRLCSVITEWFKAFCGFKSKVSRILLFSFWEFEGCSWFQMKNVMKSALFVLAFLNFRPILNEWYSVGVHSLKTIISLGQQLSLIIRSIPVAKRNSCVDSWTALLWYARQACRDVYEIHFRDRETWVQIIDASRLGFRWTWIICSQPLAKSSLAYRKLPTWLDRMPTYAFSCGPQRRNRMQGILLCQRRRIAMILVLSQGAYQCIAKL